MSGTQPSADDVAAAWWRSLTQAERAQALEAAGFTAHGSDNPSVADAWKVYKQRSRIATAGKKPPRYVVLLGRNGAPPYLFDTITKTRLESYPTVGEAEQHAMRLNRG